MIKTNLFFSIIIPVYNGLSHDLPICLDSIWNQLLSKNLYEVICVDDCSTDDTLKWLTGQQHFHNNLRVIHNQVNLRQGGARNNGVKAACGKYIMFIDQDDYFQKMIFSTIYEHLNKNKLEILIVDCAYQIHGKESYVLQHNFPHREIMTGDEIIERNTIPYAPWKFIFLRTLMINYHLFFVENERIEDVDWCHLLVHHAKFVQYQPFLFIHYNKDTSSTTMTSYKSKETTYSTLRLGVRLDNLIGTTFKDSSKKVKLYILHLEGMFYFLGLRNYFFFYDNANNKSKGIKTTISQKRKYSSFLIRTAVSFPKTYSIISNCLSPLCRLVIVIYRKIKYR
jgi:glycosyltransferase involved in cell wall biosynthesis